MKNPKNWFLSLNYADGTEHKTTPKNVQLAKNGLFTSLHGRYADELIKIGDYNDNEQVKFVQDNLEDLQESYTVHSDFPKIPFEAIKAVFSFYVWTYKTYATEAQVNFYWNKNHVKLPKIDGVTDWGNDVISYTPLQSNSAVLTSAKDDHYLWFRKNLEPYVETHSHNVMDAFMSGTDRDNSHVDGLQLVFGHVMTEGKFMLYAWTTTLNHYTQDVGADVISQYVDWPILTDHYQMTKNGEVIETSQEHYLDTTRPKDEDLADFPKDWKNQQLPMPVQTFNWGKLPDYKTPTFKNYTTGYRSRDINDFIYHRYPNDAPALTVQKDLGVASLEQVKETDGLACNIEEGTACADDGSLYFDDNEYRHILPAISMDGLVDGDLLFDSGIAFKNLTANEQHFLQDAAEMDFEDLTDAGFSIDEIVKASALLNYVQFTKSVQ